MLRCSACVVLCSLVFGPGASGQGQPAAQPAPAPSPNALQGPAVTPSDRPASIVEHDAAGHLKPLEVSPEEAAIALLGLDEATLAKVRALIDARRALVDKAVRENMDVLLQIQTAKSIQNREGQADSIKTLLDRAPGLKDLFHFRESLIEALPPAKAVQARAMVDEYWDAFAADLQDSPQAAGMSHEQIFQIELLKSLGDEIRQSYERIAQFNQRQLEETLKAVDATPEQEQKIRTLTTEYAQKLKLNQSKQARVRLFQEVAAVLTPDQLKKLMEWRQGRAATPAEPPRVSPKPSNDPPAAPNSP